MANPEHVEVVKRGAAAIAEWRKDNPEMRLQLTGAELGGADLSRADLTSAELTGADLRGELDDAEWLSGANLTAADLTSANLSFAKLTQVNFTAAKLTNTKLIGAYLGGSSFTDADLTGANLSDANLFAADFTQTNLCGASLQDVLIGIATLVGLDLSSVHDLESVKHLAPSTIDIDTLYKSKGQIPESFLRGCGVPEGLIEYLPSLMGMQEAIQFYSCFISYSHKDEDFCQRLHSRMRDEHLRVWFAPEDMQAGRKIHEQIDQAIRVHDKLLIVLSEASMKSEWVETEIHRARQREAKEGKKVLFPIGLAPFEKIKEWEAFDADIGKDMAREAREYFIPDFSNWKDHDAFESAFKRLLNDLRASE